MNLAGRPWQEPEKLPWDALATRGGTGTTIPGRAARRAAEAAGRARSLSFPVDGVAARLAMAPQPARCRAAFARRPPTPPRRESIDGQGQQQPEERQEEQEAEAGKAQGRAEEVIAAASCPASGRQWIGWTCATDGRGHHQPTLRPASRQRGAGRRRRWGGAGRRRRMGSAGRCRLDGSSATSPRYLE